MGDFGKEPLNLLSLEAECEDEVEVKTRVPLEQAVHRFRLVGRMIVDDQMESDVGRSHNKSLGMERHAR